MSTALGWAMVGAVVPMALSGLISAYFQGKSASNCIYAVAKQESLSGKLIVYPGMIEFYAILGLIISIMLAGQVGSAITAMMALA
jgi:V/A-type H+-transporting ATPase subunit K